ncbi:MAG: 2-dehydropantoate 2-reductase, partial [Alphaproteobacteria bacterium]|nr:2-dehydropantoate 2-reductase [Alphaproteobacteria bacterium]
MKIAVVGAGGVGGVFGARLAAAGHEVGLIARGAHLEAIRSTGLRINGGPRDLHVRPAFATDRPEEVSTAEAVLVAVKQWDLEAAGEAARPLVGPDTTVVPLQNGIDARERLGAILGLDRVIGGTAFINAFISEPGSIEQRTPFNRLVFGEWDGQSSARVETLAAACGPADIEAVASANIELDIWKKFVFLVAVSSVNAVVRGNNGVVRRCPETEALIGVCAAEAAAVGRARGVPLDADAGEQAAR